MQLMQHSQKVFLLTKTIFKAAFLPQLQVFFINLSKENLMLFKKRIQTETKIYRPISLLPLISKVMEKIIHNQTQDYFQRSELLCSYQSGFRASHSTDMCLS